MRLYTGFVMDGHIYDIAWTLMDIEDELMIVIITATMCAKSISYGS